MRILVVQGTVSGHKSWTVVRLLRAQLNVMTEIRVLPDTDRRYLESQAHLVVS